MDHRVPASPRAPERATENARERLLQAALRLFALHGYTGTSTREIARAANVNISAIKYYFGGKLDLYRAVLLETQADPIVCSMQDIGMECSLREALAALYARMLAPAHLNDAAPLAMKLHSREYLDPTDWGQEASSGPVHPLHAALTRLLSQQFGLHQLDEDVRRLAHLLCGLGLCLGTYAHVTDSSPGRQHGGREAIASWIDRLAMYAEAMVAVELRRRTAQ